MAAFGDAAFGQKKNPVGAGFLEALEFWLASGLGSHSSARSDGAGERQDSPWGLDGRC